MKTPTGARQRRERRRKRLAVALALVLALTLLATALAPLLGSRASAQQDTGSQTSGLADEAPIPDAEADRRESEKNAAIEAARPAVRILVQELDATALRITALEKEKAGIETRTAQLTQELDDFQRLLGETQRQIVSTRQLHRELVNELYMGGRAERGMLAQLNGNWEQTVRNDNTFVIAVAETTRKLRVLVEQEQQLEVKTRELQIQLDEKTGTLADVSRELDELAPRPEAVQRMLVGVLAGAGQPANSGTLPATGIMGAATLDAETLWRWYVLRGGVVPVRGLIDVYLEQGARYGVRGDIAFIQATLETGNFVYTGQHNYAGIGHCDNCPRGYPFPSEVNGVRAQIQLLRAYADGTFTAATSPDPIEPPLNVDTLGVRGCCTTWWGLTGVWASALHYGGTILTMYDQAVALAATGAETRTASGALGAD